MQIRSSLPSTFRYFLLNYFENFENYFENFENYFENLENYLENL